MHNDGPIAIWLTWATRMGVLEIFFSEQSCSNDKQHLP